MVQKEYSLLYCLLVLLINIEGIFGSDVQTVVKVRQELMEIFIRISARQTSLPKLIVC